MGPRGSLGRYTRTNFRGQCCTNNTEVMGRSVLSGWLFPLLERGVGGQVNCSTAEILSHDYNFLADKSKYCSQIHALASTHRLRVELHSAEPRGLRFHSLQQVCWRRDESKDTARWIAALHWYQITHTQDQIQSAGL